MNEIQKVTDALLKKIRRDGGYCDQGCDPSKLTMYKEAAYGLSLDKPVTVVSGWHILDIKDTTEMVDFFRLFPELRPSFLLVEYVIEDGSEHFSEGTRIRTSLLVKNHPPCFYETENSIYLLLGSGTRNTISVQKAEQLFGQKGIFTK